MTTVSENKSRRFLSEFEQEAAMWRQGPYGALWEQAKNTRRPNATQVSDITEQLAKNESPPTEQYVCRIYFILCRIYIITYNI